METLTNLAFTMRIWKDSRGQDLVEYALLAAFLVTAASAVMGNIAGEISPTFSKVVSAMGAAASIGQDATAGAGAAATP